MRRGVVRRNFSQQAKQERPLTSKAVSKVIDGAGGLFWSAGFAFVGFKLYQAGTSFGSSHRDGMGKYAEATMDTVIYAQLEDEYAKTKETKISAFLQKATGMQKYMLSNRCEKCKSFLLMHNINNTT